MGPVKSSMKIIMVWIKSRNEYLNTLRYGNLTLKVKALSCVLWDRRVLVKLRLVRASHVLSGLSLYVPVSVACMMKPRSGDIGVPILAHCRARSYRAYARRARVIRFSCWTRWTNSAQVSMVTRHQHYLTCWIL